MNIKITILIFVQKLLCILSEYSYNCTNNQYRDNYNCTYP